MLIGLIPCYQVSTVLHLSNVPSPEKELKTGEAHTKVRGIHKSYSGQTIWSKSTNSGLNSIPSLSALVRISGAVLPAAM